MIISVKECLWIKEGENRMKVLIDMSKGEKHSEDHKVRGSGLYVASLLASLRKYCPEDSFIEHYEGSFPEKIDLVHIPFFQPFFLTLPLKSKYKTVVTVHDLTPVLFKKEFPAGLFGNLKWQLQKRLLRKIDMIITDSESSKKDIIKIVGVEEDNIKVVYLAAGEKFRKLSLSKEEKNNFLKKYNLPEAFCLYVGDVTWNKNLENIVMAAKKANVPCVLVGKAITDETFDRKNKWNKSRVQVNEFVKNDKNFILPGFVSESDLVIFYNLASLFLMPSFYEGFGLPVVEAMQSGCPVITSREGSLSEVGGDAVYYVDPRSIDEISQAISKLIKNEGLRESLSLKGLKRSKDFSWKKTAESTLNIYKEVLKK